MENTALLLIVIAILLLIIVIILISLLLYKMLKDKGQISQANPQDNKSNFHPEILNRMNSLQKVKSQTPSLFCPNHTEEPGEVMCAICDRLFCKSCVRPFKTFHLCKEHLPLMMKYEWEEVLTLKTSTEDPERGVRLYDLKKELFNEKHHSTYVETHYKINVDNDYIETYLVLFAIKDELSMVRDFLEEKL